MQAFSTLSLPGSFLRWGGLLALALAIMAGLMGMHILGGVQAGPMIPTHANSNSAGITAVAITSPVSTTAAPADPHPSAAPSMSIENHGEVLAALNHLGSNAGCEYEPSGCEISMASHGSCMPAPGAGTPTAPQPGLVPDPSAVATASDQAGYKISGRLLDPPSLTQLSISRT